MLDLFSSAQQDLQSPNNGQLAREAQPSFGEAYQAASEANARYGGLFAETANQHDFVQQRLDAFQEATGTRIENPYGLDDGNRAERFQAARDRMSKIVTDEGFDPSLNFPSDDEIAKGGLGLARRALQKQSELASGPGTFGSVLGSTAAGAVDSATDPLNLISLAAAPEGGMLLASALRMGGAMGAQTLAGDVAKYGYRQQVNPDYGAGDVAKDVAGSAVSGALFGVGHAAGGEGVKAALGAAAGGAIGGAALGGLSGGMGGAVQGALGGAAIPLAGAGFGLSTKTLGMGWRVLRNTNPEAAAAMPLEVRDAGAVAEKAGDIQAQNPFRGASGDAAHVEAVGKIETDLLAGRPPELPQSAVDEAAARRGQVFYPGGAIDARYALAEHADLITSHDADFAVNPDYPAELQPRDRSGAPARDQVNTIAANLQPDRLGPSPEANSGAPIVGPDGVVESGNGRALAIGQAYDQGGGAAAGYRQWLEQQGYDTSGFNRPVLVGVRETPLDAGQRADFAHTANGSASLRMSATEQALSDARALDSSTLDLAKHPDLTAAANRDFVRAVVGKLPQGERGGMLTRDGGLSGNGQRRLQAAMSARAYGDPGVLARMLDDPDPNIKAIAGAMTDAAGPWARMRDAATRGDIAGGHDITGDMLQAVRSIMRARDEKRPMWEVLNQGDMFVSDTTQLASRLFFRDEEMRKPAGRARIAEALSTYAEEAAKNTSAGRLFADDVAPTDVLRATARLSDVSADLKGGALDLLRRGVETQPADAAEAVQRLDMPKDVVDAVDRTAAQDGGGDAARQGAGGAEPGGEAAAGDDGLRLARAGQDGGSAASGAGAERGLSSGPAAGRDAGRDAAQLNPSVRSASEREISAGLDTAAQDVAARQSPARPAVAASIADPTLALRNPRTGEVAAAQIATTLREAFDASTMARDPRADPLERLTQTVIGPILGKAVGDMPVYTVGSAEMRTLAEGRMKIAPGFEPAGFYDPTQGHIVVLDDAMRNRSEAARLLAHEGLHGAFMDTLNTSDSARAVVDQLRAAATDAHLARGGEAADHYGLTNAHEFVSEAFSNPGFQRFLASIPADDRIIKAFGLDDVPGQTLWDALVAAVRKVLGFMPDHQTLLDATMRVGPMLDEQRADMLRAAGNDLAPSLRRAAPEQDRLLADETLPLRPEAPTREEEIAERYRKMRAFADAKDAISYQINTDRIQQHPKGPLAGFLGILTRDIHENGGINVESVSHDYEGRMAEAMEHILEPFGSKLAGLKQNVSGIRDVVREIFGVDTKNPVAKAAAEAWGKGVDKFATDEAKRLGKVFTPAEDWRVPQFWESRRAQKFGKRTLLADMESEIASGGLKVFDPETGEEAGALRQRIILDQAADKITTDASLGGAGAGGSFKTDLRVFRFTDGEAGASSYLKLMDKYGAGQGGYLQMLQAHVGKVAKELGLSRVLGPGWMETGEQLLQDTLLAAKKREAERERPEGIVDRLKALPGGVARLATSWLESPTKAEAVWQYISGQSSGVGSELMAGLLSETRAFMTATKMGSALVTAVPADTVNFLMAAKHNGMDMGRVVTAIVDAFLRDNPERREEAARLGIVAHAGSDAAIGTKRFGDQVVGQQLFKRMADFIIRAQGLHAWDSAIRRAFPMEFLGTIAQRGGTAFADLDRPFADFLKHYAFTEADWSEMSKAEHALPVGEARFLHPDKLPEALRVKLMSAIYDESQFAYLAGGSTRVKAISAASKAGTLSGELARAMFLFKSFPMSMLATWGMRSAREAGQGRIGTAATLVAGMTMAGALSIQARALLQGKDPRSMKDPFFWGESFLQGGAAGIYGDFFKEAFSRSDTSLTETLMGPLATIPASIQSLTSGARRAAEDGQHVNFGAKLSRIISQNVPGGNLWYGRMIASRLLFDNIQKLLDRDYAKSFARQQERSMKTNHQGFFWAPGQSAPGRGPDLSSIAQHVQ